MTLVFHTDPQGSDAWLAARKGLITGSRFKDARDCTAKGLPSAKMLAYARDLARERVGGKAPSAFVNGAMRFGTEQEPLARVAYEALTGNYVEEVGFVTDDSGMFGLSPDGIIGTDGILEVKTLVSSDTLFTAVADGDISAYIDQCLGYLWMLDRQWVDLCLWAPDLEPLGLHLTVRRIERDEADLAALESDLLAFADLVRANESKLRELAHKAKPETDLPAIALDEAAELAAQRDADHAASMDRQQQAAEDLERCRDLYTSAQIVRAPVKSALANDTGARINLGEINARLAPISITVAGLAELGFEPAEMVEAGRLYCESDFAAMCQAISAHVLAVANARGAEAA